MARHKVNLNEQELVDALERSKGSVPEAATLLKTNPSNVYTYIGQMPLAKKEYDRWVAEIDAALDLCGGDTSAASEMLGIDQSRLRGHMRGYNQRKARITVERSNGSTPSKQEQAAPVPPQPVRPPTVMTPTKPSNPPPNLFEQRREPRTVMEAFKKPVDEAAPTNGRESVIHSESSRREIAAFYRNRVPRTVALQRTPSVLENVHSLDIEIGGNWFRLPTTPSMRLCTGPLVPDWSPEQEVYNGVAHLRVTFANGEVNVIALNSREPLTVAPS